MFRNGGLTTSICGIFTSEKEKCQSDGKKKTGWAQTTFAQVVHYCSERTVTCEEISGIGPEHEGDKGGKREKAKKIKKE